MNTKSYIYKSITFTYPIKSSYYYYQL